MMSFGWRPTTSCYTGSSANTQGQCPGATWFYVLLAAALAAGLAHRKPKGAA